MPSRLEGSYIGINTHEDVSQLGFGAEFLTPSQVIDRIVDDMLSRSGDGWDKAVAKWHQYTETNWAIGASNGLRLRAIFRHFGDTASLFFAKTTPEARCRVSWAMEATARRTIAANRPTISNDLQRSPTISNDVPRSPTI